MKKPAIILCPALAFLLCSLCACSFLSRLPAITFPPVLSGDITAAPPPPDFEKPVFPEPSGVFTDWSKLTAYEPVREIYSRLSPGRTDELVPAAGYGMLLPFEGEKLYVSYSDWPVGSKYGLVTMGGRIVTDAVYSSVYKLPAADGGGYLNIYVLSKYEKNPGLYPDYETKNALAAADGSWVTGFDYVYVAPVSVDGIRGVLAVIDYEKNFLVIYGENGKVISDSRDFEELDMLAPWTLAWGFSQFADGRCPVTLKSGGCGYMDARGRLMRADGEILSFVNAGAFGEGLAPASAAEFSGLWGFIDTSGNWVTEQKYISATGFNGGTALVDTGYAYQIINETGGVLSELPRYGNDYLYRETVSGRNYYCSYNTGASEYVYYDEKLNRITTDGDNARWLYGTNAFYTVADEGIKLLRADGKIILLPGAEELFSANNRGDGDFLFSAVMKDGGYAVFDLEGRKVFENAERYLFLLSDTVTGRAYVYISDNCVAGYKAFNPQTGKYVTDTEPEAPVNGLFRCRDALSAGYKDSDNEWVFRIRLDLAD